MGILVRVLALVSGLAVGFAGYFLMAAEGWPEPFQSMVIERTVLGGLVFVLGLALIWTAFKPAPKARSTVKPVVRPHADPFSLSAAPEPQVAEPAAEPEAHHAPALEPLAEVSPVMLAPVLAAVAEDPAQSAETGEGLDALMAKGDKLFAEGRLDEALDPYSEALTLARAAHGKHPSDTQATRTLANVLKSNADVYDEEGRLDTAIELYEEALKLNRTLAASGSPSDRRALSLVLERLGDCRESRGHRSRAVDLYLESLGIAEGLAQSDPGNGLYAEDLAVTRKRLVELQGETETV
ncbi:MAG TPA: hypothetical protein VG960_14030 [Caulobacteraceae bacterium]|nr:hypothetical protein [Caulobacteraceae bacterium]